MRGLRSSDQPTTGTSKRTSYFEVIDSLIEMGFISADERERWTAARKLRNHVSHPERAAVVPPGFALRMLNAIARDIDSLFAPSSA
jgi:hypothetical protein